MIPVVAAARFPLPQASGRRLRKTDDELYRPHRMGAPCRNRARLDVVCVCDLLAATVHVLYAQNFPLLYRNTSVMLKVHGHARKQEQSSFATRFVTIVHMSHAAHIIMRKQSAATRTYVGAIIQAALRRKPRTP